MKLAGMMRNNKEIKEAMLNNKVVFSGKEYKKLKYIQNVGNSYIDTGYLTSDKTDYEIKFEVMGSRTGYQQYFAGNRTEYYCPKIYQDSSSSTISIQTNQNTISTTQYITPTIMTLKIDGSNAYINGNKVGSITRNTGKNGLSNYVFNSHGETNLSAYMRLYYLKIWENGILVREYIPVLDKNKVPCLYEKIEKKYYYNIGSGTFTYA